MTSVTDFSVEALESYLRQEIGGLEGPMRVERIAENLGVHLGGVSPDGDVLDFKTRKVD